MDEVLVTQEVLDQMIRHAWSASPEECCGLLFGRANVTRGALHTSNEARSESRFFIPPSELFGFFRTLRAARADFTGIYHSHPATPPIPSETDARELHYRDVNYWIVSLRGPGPEVRCYRWRRDGFEEVGYRVVE